MLQVQVHISGDKELEAKLNKLGPSFRNFTNAMRTIGTELKSFYSGQVFASQGGALDARWKPLSRSYQLHKTKIYPGRGLMVATGAMQRSFYFKADSDSVTVGNTAPYFVYHQSSAPRSKMPRRQMLGVNSNVQDIIGNIIHQDVKNKISQAGL